MQQNSTIYNALYALYPEIKFWGSIICGLWGMYKVIYWVKQIKTNDLTHIHEGVISLEDSMKVQTCELVAELREMRKEFRDDFRNLSNILIKLK